MQDNRHGQRPLFENNFVADIPGTIHVGDDIIVVNVLTVLPQPSQNQRALSPL